MDNINIIEKNKDIPTSEVKQDILDTQNEIKNYTEERDILMRNPQDNRTRIYMLDGRILKRESFIEKLQMLLKAREESKQPNK